MNNNKYILSGRFILHMMVLLLLGYSLSAQSSPVNKPFVIPELKEWTAGNGYFIPKNSTRIVCNFKDPELLRIAQLFSDEYFQMFHIRLAVADGKVRKGDIEFIIKPDGELGKEGYSIKIANRITVSSPTAVGSYWGTRTLLQLAEQSEERKFPQGIIRDYPSSAIRGFMLDCGRKFIPISYLNDLVKVMSYYKMNTLQIHLNDNGFKQYFNHDWSQTYAAFRLESDTYPGLTAYDGFYTKAEFREFQKWAVNYGIEIIPEIDVPAHSLCFSQYLAEIGSEKYGMDHLNLFSSETYDFLDGLFKEYLEGDDPVFYGKRVHIGTDEYSNEDREVVEKFRYFTDHYIRLVESYGKQVCLWGALTHAKGETSVKSENVIMSNWSVDFANPKEMIEEGYQLISIPDRLLYIVPGAPYYHDYLDLKQLYEEWTPGQIVGETLPRDTPAILGGMFALWNDHVGNGISMKDIHYRIFPAVQTLSVKLWTREQTSLPFADFNKKRKMLGEAPGVNQLARVGDDMSLVYEREEITPGTTTGLTEIGYNYTVSFNLQSANEMKGVELFHSPNSVFYLSDPVRGLLGFVRDGYLNTFRYKVHEGKNDHIQISGDSCSTTLKVNGEVIDHMDIQMNYYNQGKDSLEYYRTLVFPLEKAGHFKSRISDFKVYNYCKE